jgi:hypothetical protein
MLCIDKFNASENIMMIKRFSIAAVAILALLLVVLGCGTSTKSLRWEDVGEGHKALVEGDVKVSARYLNSKALHTLHKYDNNPFTEYPANVFVVDVVIETASPVDVRAGDATLAAATGAKSPIRKEEFVSLWHATLVNETNSKGGGPNRYNGWSFPYVRDLIDKTVLADAVAVQAGGKVSGYLLFPREHADKGPATFTVPVFDAKGEAIGEFKFEFTP